MFSHWDLLLISDIDLLIVYWYVLLCKMTVRSFMCQSAQNCSRYFVALLYYSQLQFSVFNSNTSVLNVSTLRACSAVWRINMFKHVTWSILGRFQKLKVFQKCQIIIMSNHNKNCFEFKHLKEMKIVLNWKHISQLRGRRRAKFICYEILAHANFKTLWVKAK